MQKRAKYLLLDGFGCMLVGSHLDWSALGVQAMTDFDPGGESLIVGWGGKRTSAYSAAMLNSSFIQGFELDDYYPAAPLHSNAILLPAMLPVLQKHPEMTGRQFLLALILGYETGTRIGLALHGPEMHTHPQVSQDCWCKWNRPSIIMRRQEFLVLRTPSLSVTPVVPGSISGMLRIWLPKLAGNRATRARTTLAFKR